MYISAGEWVKAIEIIGDHGWSDMWVLNSIHNIILNPTHNTEIIGDHGWSDMWGLNPIHKIVGEGHRDHSKPWVVQHVRAKPLYVQQYLTQRWRASPTTMLFQVDRRGAEAGQGWAGGAREVRLLLEEAGAVRLRRRDLHQDGRHQGAGGAAHRGAPLGRRE